MKKSKKILGRLFQGPDINPVRDQVQAMGLISFTYRLN
jgi:hypothetical protein